LELFGDGVRYQQSRFTTVHASKKQNVVIRAAMANRRRDC
jgi:hypothetical protein